MNTAQQLRNLSLALCLLAAPALALEIGDAKSQGLVGETASGYIAAVVSSDEVDTLVKEVNAKRRTHYEAIAKKNGISVNAVEARAAEKAIEKTESGQFIDIGDGWRKK